MSMMSIYCVYIKGINARDPLSRCNGGHYFMCNNELVNGHLFFLDQEEGPEYEELHGPLYPQSVSWFTSLRITQKNEV